MTKRLPLARALLLFALDAPSRSSGDAALEAALERAMAGEYDVAAAEFAALRASDDRPLARAASYDFARARFERARGRPRPSAPPRRPSAKAVADARAQWQTVAGELRDARAALAELLLEQPDDGGAAASLAAVVAALREAEEGEARWEQAGAEAAAAAAARAGSRGPLKPGAAAARAAAGAPGEARGASSGDEGAEGAAGDDRVVRGGGGLPALREQIAAQLERVRSEQRAQDERRAEAARRRAGGRRQ
ncbi:MAG: hypothetical protein JNL90_07375 [Planctomycetes bacterium]|nr:hypothetical protein [Planctomycetota bacterium]